VLGGRYILRQAIGQMWITESDVRRPAIGWSRAAARSRRSDPLRAAIRKLRRGRPSWSRARSAASSRSIPRDGRPRAAVVVL